MHRRIGMAGGILALVLGGCGSSDDETATAEQVVAAICARRDQCKMTMRKATCEESYTLACQAGMSFDGKAARACVQAMQAADCASEMAWPSFGLPAVCESVCR